MVAATPTPPLGCIWGGRKPPLGSEVAASHLSGGRRHLCASHAPSPKVVAATSGDLSLFLFLFLFFSNLF
jgi:hypothetical protein